MLYGYERLRNIFTNLAYGIILLRRMNGDMGQGTTPVVRKRKYNRCMTSWLRG